jgi:hypothetical protein
MSVKIFDTHALQTDVLFNTNNRTTLEEEDKNQQPPPAFHPDAPLRRAQRGGGLLARAIIESTPGRCRRHPSPSPTAYDVGFLSVFP